MNESTFFLLDADYIVENNLPIIRLFGRTLDGKSIVCLDDSFEPYFYAIPKENKNEEAKKEIENFKIIENGNLISVKKVELVDKKIGLNEMKVMKVVANLPRDVPVLREKILALHSVKECREYDILFFRRYLFDKKLNPSGLVTAKGEVVEKKNYKADLILKISSIVPVINTELFIVLFFKAAIVVRAIAAPADGPSIIVAFA